MHEASLVAGLLDLALDTLQNYNDNHPEKPVGNIKEIVCGAGLLAGFEEQALKDCFEIFSENTPAANASLIINTIPLECHCRNCENDFTLSHRHFYCPACGSPEIKFSGGNGLILQAINVDCEDNNDG